MKILYNVILCFLLFAAVSFNNCKATEANAINSDTVNRKNLQLQTDTLSKKIISGKYIKTNEDGDYWYFYIKDKKGKEVKFIYNSEEILKSKDKFNGKIVNVKYINKEFEDAGSGDKFLEKYLLSVEICK
jgi:hypothetical protein